MRHGWNALRGAGLLGLLCLVGAAAPASAQTVGAGYAWAWASAPTFSGCYTPSTYYSYSSRGGTNQICNNSVGDFSVDFAGFTGYGGNVQVAAYGNDNARCKVVSWGPTTTATRAYIRCHTPAGALTNVPFVAVFHAETLTVTGGQWGAYLWSSNSTATHTPSATYQWSANGSLATVSYLGTGLYNVLLPGQHSSPTSVLVTAYGGGAEHCKIVNWGSNGTDMNIRVNCFDTFGSPANSLFTLSYTISTHDLGPGANAWAHDTTSASYVPYSWYSYNSTGLGITAGNGSVGNAWMKFNGLRSTGASNGWGTNVSSASMVTAYGNGSEYCKLAGWGDDGANSTVNFHCFTAAGAPVNTPYVGAFYNNEVPPPP